MDIWEVSNPGQVRLHLPRPVVQVILRASVVLQNETVGHVTKVNMERNWPTEFHAGGAISILVCGVWVLPAPTPHSLMVLTTVSFVHVLIVAILGMCAVCLPWIFIGIFPCD